MGRAWPTLIAGFSLAGFAVADEPAKKYQVVSPKDDAIVATAINAGGEIVGFEWVEEKRQPGIVVSTLPFACLTRPLPSSVSASPWSARNSSSEYRELSKADSCWSNILRYCRNEILQQRSWVTS